MINQKLLNDLTYETIGCAIEVHKESGPGLLERIYEKCLAHLLLESGMKVNRQKSVPISFKGLTFDADLRFDLLIEDLIIVALMTVEKVLPIHKAQLLTYLKLLKKPKGLLINFNCTNIYKEGQKLLLLKNIKNCRKDTNVSFRV